MENNNDVKPIVLFIPAGVDIVNAIINFGRERDVDITVHHATCIISEVNICNPLSDDLRFLGKFHMISLTGFYTNNNNNPYSSFAIQFTRGNPLKLFGGVIGGKLVSAEPLHVMASIVKKHEYHKVMMVHRRIQM